MKILILGSEGFIGGNLVKYFKNKNIKVLSADIVLKVDEDYLLLNPQSPNFSEIFKNNEFSCCINATGAANVQFSFEHPFTDYFLNTLNVYAILDAIRIYNPHCSFINLSSAAVYGNPKVLPIKESTKLKPSSPYGLHKLYSEQICNEFYKFYGLKTISLRIFSAYGPGLRKQLFWDLFKKVNSSKKYIELYGTGIETRDFIYIMDLMDAIYCVIISENYNGKYINVASGISTKVADAAELFINCFNPELKLKFNGAVKKGDPLYWQADISKLNNMGFKNNYSLQKGIIETSNWLKKINE